MICDQCGGEFERPKFSPSTQRFCSTRCRLKWHQHDPKYVEGRRRRQRAYWHQADGGYIVRRKRTLAHQRARVLDQLTEVDACLSAEIAATRRS